jgi:hypothetical protein
MNNKDDAMKFHYCTDMHEEALNFPLRVNYTPNALESQACWLSCRRLLELNYLGQSCWGCKLLSCSMSLLSLMLAKLEN